MNHYMKSLSIALSASLLGVAMVSCNTNEALKIKEIKDEIILKELSDYNFSYSYETPGTELSYNHMWDGYDLNNKFGPSFKKEERLYSFLTEYHQKEEGYYLLYLKKDALESSLDYMKEYEIYEYDYDPNYHFTKYDEETVIDGKYLFGHQKLNTKEKNSVQEDIKLYKANDLNDIPLKVGDYQLVLCAQNKKAIIKENFSTSSSINKEISLFKRIPISLKDGEAKNYVLNLDRIEPSVSILFDFVGKTCEVFPLDYEKMTYSYYPVLGMNNFMNIKTVRSSIINKDNKDYFLLPRYEGNEDLLDPSTDFSTSQDVFGDHKNAFLKAYAMSGDVIGESEEAGLYDY